MTKVVLLSAKGRMSPPIEMPDDDKDVVSLSYCRYAPGATKIVVSVDFRKTSECIPYGDSLVTVYKEVCVLKNTATE